MQAKPLKYCSNVFGLAYTAQGVQLHALRSRSAAARGFVSLQILVPDEWPVRQAHDLTEEIESDVCSRLPGKVVFTHIEPLDDPRALNDTTLDRQPLPPG